ncbi:MAG: hypothetical protein K2H45_09105 [Acetatifactor sp.]|nr:hypothetical protein [Acetatifactor sp.]
MAKNGYFQLVNIQNGYGIRFFPPQDGGEGIQINEVIDYLSKRSIAYDPLQLKNNRC